MQNFFAEQKRLGLSMLTGSKFLTARSKLRGRGGRASAGKMEGEGKVQHASSASPEVLCRLRGGRRRAAENLSSERHWLAFLSHSCVHTQRINIFMNEYVAARKQNN